MTPFRRAGCYLAALLATLPLPSHGAFPLYDSRAMSGDPVLQTFTEPYGENTWWLAPGCDVVSDTVRHELRPVRAGTPAEVTYQFDTVAAEAGLLLRYQVRLTRPGDKVEWSVSWDNQRFAPAAEQSWQQGAQSLDLTRYLAADRPLYVKLSLSAAGRPSDVAVGELTWVGHGLKRVAPAGLRLPRGVWVEPAWAAAQESRYLQPLPAGDPVAHGDGRVSVALRGQRAADLWLSSALGGALFGAGRTRLARALTGDLGGSLWLDEQRLAAHDLAGISVGGAVPAGLATRGSATVLAARGLPQGAVAEWYETGPLELRLLDLRTTWGETDCAAAGALCIINHGDQPHHAQVSVTVTGPGTLPAPQRIGCEVPPGPWLLPVRMVFGEPQRWAEDGTVYRVTAVIDDGRTISDQLQRPLVLDPGLARRPFCGLLSIALRDHGNWLSELPVDQAELTLAAERGVPVALQAASEAQAVAARLEYLQRPPVVVVAGP